MKLTKKLSITVCSLTTALVSTAVITNAYKAVAQTGGGPELITNGSFESDPLIDPNNPTAPNPNITGWTKSEPFNPADTPGVNISGIRISNFPNFGNQGLSLSSIAGSPEISYISQTIPTVKGQYYTLTYYFASIEEAPDVKNKFQVFIGGKKFSNDKNTAFQPYAPTTISFKAKGESTEIKFGYKVKYAFLFLDDVSVKSVPEP
ncbi:DUF642 domain-containing protein [Nostoc sp. NMS8]|uniref:DUF642 domain-containing protein n=1 Tax=Nostoc sp. NMS8 TaxID=2815392 RepID=UPI0025FFA152|nr:DUF642 domain-containing protein [Nostoc sp. NMS8]MBN3958845.1 DUF642 domain-containing protein [Nostoc sp. NMS8]